MNRVAKQLAVLSASLLPAVAAPVAGALTTPVLTFSPLPGAEEILGVPLLDPNLFPPDMTRALRGTFCSGDLACQQVVYSPLNIREGEDMLTAALPQALADSESGKVVVFAYSQGGQVVEQWLKNNVVDADPDSLPSRDELVFVTYGNSTRKYGGSLAYGSFGTRENELWPDTQYQVLDISHQYDYTTDKPDNPFNGLAYLNAIMGLAFVHGDYTFIDPYDPANAVWTEGNITYVLAPTAHLPLLEPLRRMGFTELAAALDEPLRALVEKGYDRPQEFGVQDWGDWEDPGNPALPPESSMVQLDLAPEQTATADLVEDSTGPEQSDDTGEDQALSATTTSPDAELSSDDLTPADDTQLETGSADDATDEPDDAAAAEELETGGADDATDEADDAAATEELATAESTDADSQGDQGQPDEVGGGDETTTTSDDQTSSSADDGEEAADNADAEAADSNG